MPIPIEQQITAILISLSLFLIIVRVIRKRTLREEYALLWIAAGLTILLLSIFGGLADLLASLFAVHYAPTLILVLGLIFALAVLLAQSVALSTQSDRVRDLTQQVALLDWQVRQLSQYKGRPDVDGDGQDGRQSPPPPTPHPSASGPARRADKVLVIGLDGATFDLIKPWAAEGALPTLGRLMRDGAYGALHTTLPPMTAPAWTSFATGVNPGKHGLYDWSAREAGSYRFAPVTALDATAPTLYAMLSQAGRRVCTLNVPMTYPPTPVNGVMVSGLPAPSTQARISYPPDLFAEMVQAAGDYILYPDPGQAYSAAGVDAFLQRLYRCTELRASAFDTLRAREAWDFAMVVFNGTDTICHALWKYMDRDHPLYEPRHAARYGSAIRDYYQYIDQHLARLVETMDENTTLFIMSDHGSGPFHKFIHVNNWLIEEGLMHLRSGPGSRLKQGLFRMGVTPMNTYNTLMKFGLGALKREVVRGQGQRLLKTLFLSFEDVDWGRTAAYSLGNVGQIYVNLKGREPLGCVQPGAAYEQVRERLIARLWELRDPNSGEQVVEAVYRREEVYRGEQVQYAPDILFIPRRMEYFGFGEYEFGSHRVIEAMQRGISGTHRMHGMALAYGPAVRPGVVVENAEIVDLAPTILHVMGVPIPASMDGRVLSEILADDFQPAQVHAQTRSQPDPAGGDGSGLSEEDERILLERLSALGYVG